MSRMQEICRCLLSSLSDPHNIQVFYGWQADCNYLCLALITFKMACCLNMVCSQFLYKEKNWGLNFKKHSRIIYNTCTWSQFNLSAEFSNLALRLCVWSTIMLQCYAKKQNIIDYRKSSVYVQKLKVRLGSCSKQT